MDKINWNEAPEWADRVVESPRHRQLFWASEIERKSFKSGHQAVNNLHVRDNWEVVERRPTADTGIDWSKAPHWADRVVRGGTLNMNYWASDCMLQPVNNSCPPFKTNNHIRNRLPVVERRPVPKNIDVRAAFATAKPLVTFSHPCNAEPAPITIEQRIASLRALEKQVEETRAELTRDLETLGLTWMVRDEPTITDWRDLRVGDVIVIDYVNGDHFGGVRKFALEGRESIIVSDGDLYPVCVTNDLYPKGQSLNMYSAVKSGCRWRFIRRP